MALSKNEKVKIVEEVKEVASSASSLVISDARGLKVSELTEIRTKANQSGIHIQVIKNSCLLYTSPSPRDKSSSRMPSSA